MDSDSRNDADELLVLQDISLDYGSINALKNLSLRIRCSEVHAIVGEHGAGKSSLAKLASGMLKPGSGLIRFRGTSYPELTAARAHAAGIEMVYQEMQVFDHLTVMEHFFLLPRSAPPLPRFLLARRQAARVQGFISQAGFEIDAEAKIRDLSRTDQLLVDILKSLFQEPKLLILDEVFERITSSDLERFLPLFHRRKEEGMSVMLITHKIDDVYAFADTVSIVKNGEILLTGPVNDIDKMNLIKLSYTQISKEEQFKNLGHEFYQYLRFNEAILQFLPVVLLVVDRDRRVKMVNFSACEFFGFDRKEHLNTPLESLFEEGNEDTLGKIDGFLSAGRQKSVYSAPLRLRGRELIVNLIVYPIRDGSYPIGHMIIIEDQTEQERLRSQLVLSEKLASVGLLAAGVAHEINNPLGIIVNYLASMKFRFTEPELRTRIENVEEQIQFITSIVSQLLLFSDRGKAVREDINVVDVVKSLIGFVQFSFKNSNIRIRLENPREAVRLHANENEVKQVMLNLMKNSFEAMPKGGTIDVSVDTESEAGDSPVIIRFRDSGPGIPQENPNDIFLPFYSTKRGKEQQNLGLGLSVTYGIIRKYNGTITVENLATEGCQFTIRIPRS